MSTQDLTISETPVNDETLERIDVFGEYAGFVTRLVAFVSDLVIIIMAISIMGAVTNLLDDFLRFNDTTAMLLNFAVAIRAC